MSFTRLCFKLTDGENYIDIAKAMSMYYRTLFHQKQVFTILGGQIVDNVSSSSPNTLSAVKISTAPNTWYFKDAINRCFHSWKAQRARTLNNTEQDGGEVSTGKYADFKITLNGVSAGAANNVTPYYLAGTSLQPLAPYGEWATASVVNEAGDERHFRIVGDHTTTWYGAMKGWLQTLPLPDAENEPDMLDLDGNSVYDYKEDFLNLLNETGDGQSERLTLLYEDNDNAPFAVRDVYGDVNSASNLQLQSLTYLSANNPHQSVPGFKALCGLLRVDVGAEASNPVLFIDVMNTPEAF